MASPAFDIIIVGGGTAGCVLANRLSEYEHISVLLVESGEDLTKDLRTNVPTMGALLMGTNANWGFVTAPQPKLGNRTNIAPAGRLLGGSSAINGFAFIPNSKSNVEAWANLGNPGWDWQAFSKSMERFSLATSAKDSVSSPLQITIPEEDTQWAQVWRDTLLALGFPVAPDALISGDILGSLMGGETIGPDKTRSYSGKAYLNDAIRERKNLTIWPETTVERILFSDSEPPTAIGVELRDTKTGSLKRILAHKEVILSAGALNSPRLLELSGVGDPKRLESLGLKAVINNSNVGEHLQNHPLVTVSFEAHDEDGFNTIDQLLRKDPEAIAAVQAAYSKGYGPGSKSNLNVLAQLPIVNDVELKHILDNMVPQRSNGPASLIEAHEAFVKAVVTSPKEASGCYMTAPGYMCLSGTGSFTPPEPGREKFFTMGIHLAHPLSRGSVHITSSSPPISSSDISIDPNFFSHPLDVEILARHVQLAERIAMTKPLSLHLKPDGKRSPGMPEPGGFSDIEKAKDYVLQRASGAHHWTGSCAMMPKELGGVVDSQLKVYGCANLRVCDASIIPIAPRSNPQGVIYAVAEHGAGIILSSLTASEQV